MKRKVKWLIPCLVACFMVVGLVQTASYTFATTEEVQTEETTDELNTDESSEFSNEDANSFDPDLNGDESLSEETMSNYKIFDEGKPVGKRAYLFVHHARVDYGRTVGTACEVDDFIVVKLLVKRYCNASAGDDRGERDHPIGMRIADYRDAGIGESAAVKRGSELLHRAPEILVGKLAEYVSLAENILRLASEFLSR